VVRSRSKKTIKDEETLIDMTNGLPARIFLFFLVFTAIMVVFSYWSGQFFLNSILTVLIGIVLGFIVLKKIEPDFNQSIPIPIWAFAGLVFILVLFSVFAGPGYLGSTDGMHFVHQRITQEKIPTTYAPYSPVKAYYFFGFTLFAKPFVDFFSMVPDLFILYFLGAVFAALEVILVFLVVSKFFKSENTGFWAALLFCGSKIVFQSFLLGLFPGIFGTVFFLAVVWAWLSKSDAVFLFFPTALLLHFSPLLFLGFLGVLGVVFFRQSIRKELFSNLPWLKIGLAIFLAIPVFGTFLAMGQQGWNQVVYHEQILPIETSITQYSLLEAISSTVLLLGWVPLVILLFTIFFYLKKREPIQVIEWFLLAVVVLSLLLVLFTGIPVISKLAELASLAAVVLGGLFLNRLDLRRWFKPALTMLLLLLILGSFFYSNELSRLREGSKISREQAAFAFSFKEQFPERAKTLFLTPNSSLLAVFSDKIPFDVLNGFFISMVSRSTDPLFELEIKKSLEKKRILETHCIDCLQNLDVQFIVAPKGFYPTSLPFPKVFESNGFEVYKKTENAS